LLQHPRERRTAIGTARMAHLGLAGSTLRIGLDFADDEVVREFLAHETPSYVLFPGPGARDVGTLSRDEAIGLVVLDGTWWQAKKLITLNPRLAALPRLAFSPRRPSDYRIRRQPADFCVSTIEALAETLRALEPGDPERFGSLLAPFRAMVDGQLRFVNEVRASRHAARKRRTPRRPTLGARLEALGARLVVAHGDANGWPRRHPERRPAELVHWVAERVGGERFEAVIAPASPLGPSTVAHTGLAGDALANGLTRAEAAARWRAFLRPDDVLLTFGAFHRGLAMEAGLAPPAEQIDLRCELLQCGHDARGGLEHAADALGCRHDQRGARATRRLASLLAIVTRLRGHAVERAAVDSAAVPC
jgi:DTW domain-containing protein YfiP